ncbi:hypothetical protein BT63DRAFT_207270 [Microthyrium microscopicum]|uniref:Uncharacterized protein n=1 Tax=Microthyrium microscopicum TaxID=703497 RepID=A0A6A6UJ28_9PEZI|nr:hypothetical protein BT63DRAFT_207270 [Microthyrium microscopicum]
MGVSSFRHEKRTWSFKERLVIHIRDHVRDCLQGNTEICDPPQVRLDDLRRLRRQRTDTLPLTQSSVDPPTLGASNPLPILPRTMLPPPPSELPPSTPTNRPGHQPGLSIVLTPDSPGMGSATPGAESDREPPYSALFAKTDKEVTPEAVSQRTSHTSESHSNSLTDSHYNSNSPIPLPAHYSQGSYWTPHASNPPFSPMSSNGPVSPFFPNMTGEPGRFDDEGNRHESMSDIIPLPRNAHGILIHPNVRRTRVEPPRTSSLKLRASALAMSSTDGGVLVAHLVDKRIHLRRVTSRSISNLPDVYLAGYSWTGMSLAGSFLGCWGMSGGSKIVHLRDLNQAHHERTESARSSLKQVAASPRGAFALVCSTELQLMGVREYVDITFINTGSDADKPSNTNGQTLISGSTVSHAAFNDTGDLLFAWIERGEANYVYVWRINYDGNLSASLESPKLYERARAGEYTFKVLPLNTYQGCLVTKTFPRSRDLFRVPFGVQPTGVLLNAPQSVQIPGTLKIFGDHSLLVLDTEKVKPENKRSPFHRSKPFTKIYEWEIDMAGNGTLKNVWQELCAFEGEAKPGMGFCVGKDGGTIIVVVAGLDGLVQVSDFKPAVLETMEE